MPVGGYHSWQWDETSTFTHSLSLKSPCWVGSNCRWRLSPSPPVCGHLCEHLFDPCGLEDVGAVGPLWSDLTVVLLGLPACSDQTMPGRRSLSESFQQQQYCNLPFFLIPQFMDSLADPYTWCSGPWSHVSLLRDGWEVILNCWIALVLDPAPVTFWVSVLVSISLAFLGSAKPHCHLGATRVVVIAGIAAACPSMSCVHRLHLWVPVSFGSVWLVMVGALVGAADLSC